MKQFVTPQVLKYNIYIPNMSICPRFKYDRQGYTKESAHIPFRSTCMMFYVSLQRYIKWEIVLYLKLLHNNTKKRPGSKLWGCAYLLMMLCLCCKCFPLLFLFCSNALTFSICNCSFILLHTGETNHIKNIKCAWFEELHVWALQTWALFTIHNILKSKQYWTTIITNVIC